MSNCLCRTTWRGILPILVLLSLFFIAVIFGYEWGRYHRNLADMVYAGQQGMGQ